jgi:adenosylhomocysteine nucleosidase
MKYGLIGAMDEEIAYLLEKMTKRKEYTIANSLFIEGKINEKEVVLLKSGIGKVNAAMATTILMERFNPNVVINTGSAGGFSTNLSVGDIVISDEVVHHDVDATAFKYEYGQVPRLPATFKADASLIEETKQVMDELDLNYEIGLVATGDSFMSDEEKIERVKEIFPNILAAEMEGAAIAQVCYQYSIPFIVIRAISDVAGKDSPVSFEQFLQKAAKNASEIILQLLNK